MKPECPLPESHGQSGDEPFPEFRLEVSFFFPLMMWHANYSSPFLFFFRNPVDNPFFLFESRVLVESIISVFWHSSFFCSFRPEGVEDAETTFDAKCESSVPSLPGRCLPSFGRVAGTPSSPRRAPIFPLFVRK